MMWKIFGKRRQLCQELKNCQELEFLPYHRLGLHAYRQLGRNYQLEEHASMSRWDVYQKMGISVRNGLDV